MENSGVFKEHFRLAPLYIRGLRSSVMLCRVGRKVVADVSGLITDPFFRGEGLFGAWKVISILSRKVGNYSLEFDA